MCGKEVDFAEPWCDHETMEESAFLNMPKIVLTDWPKLRDIEAHYRGVETQELFRKLDESFHLMMPGAYPDHGGGYLIFFEPEEIKKELEFRKARREKGCAFCKTKRCPGSWNPGDKD